MVAATRPVGRPRASGPSRTGLSPRQELLEAAAELFTTRGYTATSTRAIAERAGLRQASLYHWFGGKEDLLAVLLESTVRPSLRTAHALRRYAADGGDGTGPWARLWALAHADTALLCGVRHNLGTLYLLPETAGEPFAPFRALRRELRDAYRTALAEAGRPGPVHTRLVFGLVESAILVRRDDPGLDVAAHAAASADAVLRVAGCPGEETAGAAAGGRELLAAVGPAGPPES
ncbi:TetR family transcriptional regulator [Streptomyces carminius]|uniref:TetR family transcriptional regulator n=1 Tax=Streptomyces carminius TaxID=2665496 RepID=A0A2M8LT35_9ACTN|nr:TetR/AcrR family transcriptional regulator [Streptomyces carminius]PJE95089.1 TetR family transcriptional regulator [Streptomyces carminius]